MPDKVLVTFTKRVPPYNPNETAGFPPDRAAELVKEGKAVYLAMDEQGQLVRTRATLAAATDLVTAEQTAAGMFPPIQEATRAPTNAVDDALVPTSGSEGTRADVAMRAKSDQLRQAEEKGEQPEPEPFVIPAVQAPPAAVEAPAADGPPPVEPGTPEESERAAATLEEAQKAQQEMQSGGDEPPSDDEPKKRGRPKKD